MFIPTFLAALTLAATPKAAIQTGAVMVVKPDITDGTVIKQRHTMRVIVQSDAIVTQVEFYVNDDLRDTATATPYTFTLDPLIEKDGPEKLTFTAYNTDGAKASKTVTVTVDSGASLGAEANTKIAQDLMTESKFDDAIYAARIALKSTPDYVPAQLLLAHAFLAKKVYDKAQEFAEDALRTNPNMTEGLELVATIQLERAFNAYTGTGDRMEFMSNMADAVDAAINARRKVLDKQFDSLPAPESVDPLKYGRVAVATGHFGAAISAMSRAFGKSFDTKLGDLIGYAQLRVGRFNDLLKTLNQMKANNTLDGYSYALWAVADEYLGDKTGADDNIREAILDKASDLGVETAQVYIALRRGNISTMEGLAANLQANNSQLPETNFYLAILLHRMGREEDSDKAFQQTVLDDPLSYELYIFRGKQALAKLLSGKDKGADAAYDSKLSLRMFVAALRAKPDSAEAMTALADSELIGKAETAAQKEIDTAIAADPEYAGAFYTGASIYNSLAYSLQAAADRIKREAANGIDGETQSEIDQRNKASTDARTKAFDLFATAQKLDAVRLAGTRIPRTDEVFPYLQKYGMLPVITPPQ